MPRSQQQIQDAYVRHGIALIRAANGLASTADAQLLKLIADLRYLLSQTPPNELGRRALSALIAAISDAVYQRYNTIADDQADSLAELVDVETEFAQKASGFDSLPSATAMTGVVSGLLLFGASIKASWQKQAADLVFRIAATIRSAQSAQDASAAVSATLFGTRARQSAAVTNTTNPRASVGGELGAARRRAEALVHTAASSAAQDARIATFKANGVKYMQWHAVLDAKVCPVCAIRADKLWTLDGEPIGHDIPYLDIPCHYWDRCLWMPMSGDPPADGSGTASKFDDWLDSLSEDEQNDVLGTGRAQLYRDGTITLADLLNQSGQLMSLAELRASHK